MNKAGQPIDGFARDLARETQAAVAKSAGGRTERRVDLLQRDYGDVNGLRRLAGAIKQHTLDHLDTYLEQAEAALTAGGAQVHFASDAAAARERIRDILASHGVKTVVKSKSMATEEIHLNDFLEGHGIECVESVPTTPPPLKFPFSPFHPPHSKKAHLL